MYLLRSLLTEPSSYSSPSESGFPDRSGVKNPPAMPETWVQYLGQEDPLEEEMATHPSILAWEIPREEEPGGLQSTGVTEESNTIEATE